MKVKKVSLSSIPFWPPDLSIILVILITGYVRWVYGEVGKETRHRGQLSSKVGFCTLNEV